MVEDRKWDMMLFCNNKRGHGKWWDRGNGCDKVRYTKLMQQGKCNVTGCHRKWDGTVWV